jgi:hypothetical protein
MPSGAVSEALAAATEELTPHDYLDANLADLRVETQDLRIEMHDIKADIIERLAGLLILQAGVAAALVKLL